MVRINSHKHKNNKHKTKTILVYIYNVVEDEWSFISGISNPDKRREEIYSDNNTADCYLFANADQEKFIYITPKNISYTFRKYFQNLVGAKKADIIIPRKKSGLICKDFCNDKLLFESFIKKIRKYQKVILVSYATSPQFLDLKAKLIQKKVNVVTPEAPEVECAWTVNFFGSKSGIRQLAQQSTALEPDFIMPEGLICVGKLDAAKIAANKYIKDKGVVIKTNKGSGGNGILIFRDGDLPYDYKECERIIYNKFCQNDYWERYPIIVEDLINSSSMNGSSYPNIEFKIHKNGRIEMLYYCLMYVTKEGAFYGLDINSELINDRLAARIIDTGFYIAERYAAEGYRGHFDIDMIATKYNQVFVNESNTRNTGGTDVYKIALELIGKDFFRDAYIISRSKFRINSIKRPTFTKVLKQLDPILFSKKTKEGVVISSENKIKQKELIYIIFGKNKRRAYQIENDLKHILHG